MGQCDDLLCPTALLSFFYFFFFGAGPGGGLSGAEFVVAWLVTRGLARRIRNASEMDLEPFAREVIAIGCVGVRIFAPLALRSCCSPNSQRCVRYKLTMSRAKT
jgi:hypothetical protein